MTRCMFMLRVPDMDKINLIKSMSFIQAFSPIYLISLNIRMPIIWLMLGSV